MFEKIYACLLRLYPPAFRRRYEKEALQLLHNRLRDERGFFRRSRLIFDLVVDMIGALPQAYRNSYTEVAAVASLTRPIDGIPSFQSLHDEPIRRGAFVFGSILTLSVLATFGYVMGLPNPYPVAGPSDSASPIETVLEHLNKPRPSDPAANFYSVSSQPAASSVSGSESLQISTTNAAAQPRARFLPIPDGQSLPPSRQGSNPRAFDQVTSNPPAALSSPMKGVRQSVPVKPAAVPVVAPSATLLIRQAIDVVTPGISGNWIGSLRADDGYVDTPHQFTFDQRGAVLNGAGGPNSIDQYPIIHGSVAGDSVRFELNHERKSFLYDLKIEGEELRGTLSVTSANRTRTATVLLKRAH